MNCARRDIILLLDKESERKALALAAQIKVEGENTFKIDNQKYFAHVSLYFPYLPEENLENVEQIVKKIAASTERFALSVNGLEAADSSIAIQFRKINILEKLHETIVETVNPLRNGAIRDKELKGIEAGDFSPEQSAMIMAYGVPNILKLYQPHLTLARLSSDEEAKNGAINLNKESDLKTVQAIGLGIAEMGPHGTVTKIIKKFSFK